PTGKDGDSHVISRYSAASSASVIPRLASTGGGSFVVMSMGMAVMSMATTIVMVVMVAMIMMVMMIAVRVMMILMMVLAMIMGVRMIMCMILAGVAVLLMRMSVRRTGIGATFRIERRLDLDDARAEPLHHRLDDVIPADA